MDFEQFPEEDLSVGASFWIELLIRTIEECLKKQAELIILLTKSIY